MAFIRGEWMNDREPDTSGPVLPRDALDSADGLASRDMPSPSCLHCEQAEPCCPRGLCRRCYRRSEIRKRFPPIKLRRDAFPVDRKYLRCQAPLPEQPTAARPGTETKIAVLCQRVQEGYQLWHPDDAPMDRESAPEADLPDPAVVPVHEPTDGGRVIGGRRSA
jgi:hypothetical protein